MNAPTCRIAGTAGGELGGQPARRGMTLIEMTIVVSVVSAGLFLLVGWTGQAREQAKHDLAVRMLADLEKALSRYHRSTGRFPSSPGPDSAISATICLLDHDRTRPILEALPPSLWRGPGRRNLIDPWGTPLRFFPAGSDHEWVKANNGRPVFVSAGPDRSFGDGDPAQVGDNLRSDDPGPDGFRLEHMMRDSVSGEEQDRGEKDD